MLKCIGREQRFLFQTSLYVIYIKEWICVVGRATKSTEQLELLDDNEHILRIKILGGDHRLKGLTEVGVFGTYDRAATKFGGRGVLKQSSFSILTITMKIRNSGRSLWMSIEIFISVFSLYLIGSVVGIRSTELGNCRKTVR